MTAGWLEGAMLMSPLLGGALLHGLCIRFGLGKGLAKPLDQGLHFRGRRLFGDNKTYRGLLGVAAGTALLFPFWVTIPDLAPWTGAERACLGFGLGACAMLAELPNSFLKRQAGLPPGAQGKGARGVVFHLLDQVDLVIGAWSMLAPFVAVTVERVAGSVVVVYLAHQVVTGLGYSLGMRATAR